MRWQKSTSGPDLTDCFGLMRELEQHHEVGVTLLLTAGGFVGGLPVSLLVIALPRKLDDPWEGLSWSAERSWPNPNQKTFEGALYSVLLDLDSLLCEKRWVQMVIPA